MSPGRSTIDLAGGASAIAVEVDHDANGETVLSDLGLPAPRGTVVLNGTTGDLEPELRARLTVVLGLVGLAGALEAERLTAVTGGTDAGVFAMVGGAVGDRRAPLIGVAPAGMVSWPGRRPDEDLVEGRRVALEPHHSHFVLVAGRRWGDETPVLLALAAALGASAPSVAVICGGGHLTRNEARGHFRARRRLVVLAGSGRFADELAADPGALDPAGNDLVHVCPVSGGPAAVVAAVLTALERGLPPAGT